MPNFDGLYELRGIYTTTPAGFSTMQHRFTIDVNIRDVIAVGTDFTLITVTDEAELDPKPLDEVCDVLGTLWQAVYPDEATLGRFELWRIEEGTTDALYISQYDVSLAGTNINPSHPAGQATFTFRSKAGGTARFQLMESSFNGDTKETTPYASALAANIADYITNGDATPAERYFLARDNSVIFANIHFSQGQNEKLYRKRYRS